MLVKENQFLTRAEPNGNGGLQFIYRVDNYGLTVISSPQEEISQIHWEVDVIKYLEAGKVEFEVCHSTELADKTLKFYNDKSVNEFIQKACAYFKELNTLENMLPE